MRQHEAVAGQSVRNQLRRTFWRGIAGHQRGDEGPAYPDRAVPSLFSATTVRRSRLSASACSAGGVPVGAAGCLIVEIGCRAALLVGVLVVGSIDVSGAEGAVAVSNAHGTVTGAAGGVLLRPFVRLISKDGDSVTTYGEPWDMK